MNKLTHIFLIIFVGSLVFHFTQRISVFAITNWANEPSAWPDEKSFIWTLKNGFWVTIPFAIAMSLALLNLLRKKYQKINLPITFRVFAFLSFMAGLTAAYLLSMDTSALSNPWVFTILQLSPLWVLIFFVFVLKGLNKKCS